jgi:hypothetical protein
MPSRRGRGGGTTERAWMKQRAPDLSWMAKASFSSLVILARYLGLLSAIFYTMCLLQHSPPLGETQFPN